MDLASPARKVFLHQFAYAHDFFLKKSKLAAAIGHLPYKALHSCRYFNIYYWRINPETKSGDAGIKTPTF